MISVVIPIYNEEALIDRLHPEVTAALEPLGLPWEVVYVDDGSRDRSLALLKGWQAADPHVVVVELSRNWGHQAALTAGLSVAGGDAVVLMDGDFQDPPALIGEFVAAWRRGAQVVVGVRRRRAEWWGRRWLFALFYQALGWLSDYPIPLNAGVFGLLDRRAVDAINRLQETNRFLPGLRTWVGYRTAVVEYDRDGRAAGAPKQTLWKLLRYGFDAIFSFSYKPLRLTPFGGMFVCLFALVYGAALITCRLLDVGIFGGPVVVGYTSTIVAVLFLGGVQLIGIGILGEYIGRIYDEVKRRPLFLVNAVHRAEAPAGPAAPAFAPSGRGKACE
jgi:dolichol-phosphate mannosyltransferase